MGAEQSRLSEKEAMRLELESKHLVRPEEAIQLYEGFVKQFGGSEVEEQQFVSFYHQVYKSQLRNPVIEKLIVQLHSKNPGSQTIKFDDLALSIGVAEHGSLEDKVKWVFNLFDVDCSQSIDKLEMLELMRMAHRIRSPTDHIMQDSSDKTISQSFFEGHDKNVLTKDEFVQECFRHVDIASAMTNAIGSVLVDMKKELVKGAQSR